MQQEGSAILELTGVMGDLIAMTNQMKEIVQVRKHVRYCSKGFDTSSQSSLAVSSCLKDHLKILYILAS